MSIRIPNTVQVAVLGTLMAIFGVLAQGPFEPVHCQESEVYHSAEQADSLIAAARLELGLSVSDSTADFTDIDELTQRIRILTKQLAATGAFSKPELADIKMAGHDAEEALRRNGGRSQRYGRVVMEEWMEALETIGLIY